MTIDLKQHSAPSHGMLDVRGPARALWAGLAGTALLLGGCDLRSPADARQALGQRNVQEIDGIVAAMKRIDDASSRVDRGGAAMLAALQLQTGKPEADLVKMHDEVYKRLPSGFVSEHAASIVYEGLLNPRIPSSSKLTDQVIWFNKKSTVDADSALLLALATFKSGLAQEEIFDAYVVFTDSSGITAYQAAQMTFEWAKPTNVFPPKE